MNHQQPWSTVLPRAAWFIGWLLVAASRILAAADPVAVLVTGERFPARFVGIDSQFRLELESAGKSRRIPAHDLVTWGWRGDARERLVVVLADGGLLATDELRLAGEELLIPASARTMWSGVKLPVSAASGVIFQWPADAQRRDEWLRKIAANNQTQDELWLDNGDLLAGTLAPRPPIDAAESEREPLPFQLKTKSGAVTVPAPRVAAIIFNPARRTTAKPRGTFVQLGFRDGTLLFVRQIEIAAAQVRLGIVGGATLEIDVDSFRDELSFVQMFGPAITYVSDLKPASYKHIPFLTQGWPFESDHSVGGGRLRQRGQLFSKGLGMHSTSRLAYDLGGRFRSLQAELAIDERSGTRGSVQFRVKVDRGDNDWQSAYESPLVRGGDEPLPITVDVSQMQRMALIVDFADHGDEGDHANWLNARLIPAPSP